jgi:hypothetical protein
MDEFKSDTKNWFNSPRNSLYNSDGGPGGDSMIRHIDSELQALKDLALQMGGHVEKALANACTAILNENRKAVEEVHRHE